MLDNDTDPDSAILTATLVDAPANTALFELRPDGTFDYTHDGGNSTADSFTYRADDGPNVSNVATVSITINPVNDRPELTLLGPAVVNLMTGDAFTDPGATANDEEDGDITANILVGGDVVDTNTVGTYVITYDVSDSGGAAATQITRTVNVATDSAPVITLNGSAVVNVVVGGTFSDPGATATDAEDGDLTANIVVGGDVVDTDTLGTYVITYNVSDSSGNAATEVTRTVIVRNTDVNPPVITLIGPATTTHGLWTTYRDPGATAMDAEDGDLTAAIVVGGDTVNGNLAGTCVITYNVSDSDGNAAAEVTRTVIVEAERGPPNRGSGGGGSFGPTELLFLMVMLLVGMTRRRQPARA